MRSGSCLVAALLAAVVLQSPARAAQDAAALKKDMVAVGQWELSTTDRSKTCVVT